MRRISMALITACLALTATAAQAFEVDRIIAGRGDDYRPSSNGTVLAWNHNLHVSLRSPKTDSRANAPFTKGWMGSVVPGTDKVVYQQVRNYTSNLWVYDVSRESRHTLEGANTSDWEWWPVASSAWVLFKRGVYSDRGRYLRTDLLLLDRTGGDIRTVKRDVSRGVYPGWVGHDLAAWTTCTKETCNVWTYRPSADEFWKLPGPDDKEQYAPAIDEDAGVIYFIRGGHRCGRGGVSLRRASLSTPETTEVLVDFQAGLDVDVSLSLAPSADATAQDLYFSRVTCSKLDWIVYAARDIDGPVVPVSAPGMPSREPRHSATSQGIAKPWRGAQPNDPPEYLV